MISKTKYILIILLTLTVCAYASTGGDHAEHHFDWMGFLGKLLNSVILFGGLIYLLRKPIVKLLDQKSTDIKTDIIKREKELAETTRRLDQIMKRLDDIESEVNDMKEKARESGEEEKKRVLELAEKESQRIQKLTEEEINQKIESSLRRLKAKIADLTIDHFKKGIVQKLDNKSHKKIIDDNIKVCGELIERK